MTDPAPIDSCKLSELPVDGCGIIVAISDHDDMLRLKAMGLCLGRRVEVIKSGRPLIVRVFGSRVGLCQRLAKEITVQACPSAPRCWEAQHLFSKAD